MSENKREFTQMRTLTIALKGRDGCTGRLPVRLPFKRWFLIDALTKADDRAMRLLCDNKAELDALVERLLTGSMRIQLTGSGRVRV